LRFLQRRINFAACGSSLPSPPPLSLSLSPSLDGEEIEEGVGGEGGTKPLFLIKCSRRPMTHPHVSSHTRSPFRHAPRFYENRSCVAGDAGKDSGVGRVFLLERERIVEFIRELASSRSAAIVHSFLSFPSVSREAGEKKETGSARPSFQAGPSSDPRRGLLRFLSIIITREPRGAEIKVYASAARK